MHIHLQHITTQEQSNTVKCLQPGSDIMGHLEEHIYNEILELDTHILDTLPEGGGCPLLKCDITKS